MKMKHAEGAMTETRPSPREFAAFISFAEPDRPLAEMLQRVLSHAGLPSYYAPKVVPANTPARWQRRILDDGIRKSDSFVLICTKESLSRSWVLFEAGAAAALGGNCYCTMVQSVSDADIRSMPDPLDLYHYKLYNSKELQDLLRHVAKDHLGESCQEMVQKIDDMFASQHHLLGGLMSLAARRWVFIAGNVPRKRPAISRKRKVYMRAFVKNFTECLMKSGFSIAACPQVRPVGKVALNTAEVFVASLAKREPFGSGRVDYEIGGLYPVDRMLRPKGLKSTRAESKWQEHLMRFRKSYLEKQEWLVLIGGSEGTREEYQAIEAINNERRAKVKTYPIPCFGGSAAAIFRELVRAGTDYLKPCIGCRPQNGKCPYLQDIVETMSRP
jgi:hypothetical protein